MAEKILITGGAGFIGSHTCKSLFEKNNYELIVLDNLSRGFLHNVQYGIFEHGDLLDYSNLIRVFRKYKPTAVIHFAALAYVGESVQDPILYYRNNVIGSINLLEAMVQCECDQIVFSSSCATYGVPQHSPIHENQTQNPINPYGFGKLAVEKALYDFDKAYKIRSVMLRYFNASGCDPEGELGEEHDPETHLIPLVVQAALGMRASITIFGSDYETIDGTCVRDYIHVNDLADAHIKSLEYLQNGGKTVALNLGNGKGYSVKQVIDTVKAATQKDFEVIHGPRREGDPSKLIARSELAEKTIKWQPKIPHLEEHIKHVVNWYKKDQH